MHTQSQTQHGDGYNKCGIFLLETSDNPRARCLTPVGQIAQQMTKLFIQCQRLTEPLLKAVLVMRSL